jgi:hypothetical protein
VIKSRFLNQSSESTCAELQPSSAMYLTWPAAACADQPVSLRCNHDLSAVRMSWIGRFVP